MPFTKGDPNCNRKGRPKKGLALNDVIEESSRETVLDGDGKRRERLHVLVNRMWDMALAGDGTMAKYLVDRLGGKPTEKILTGNMDVTETPQWEMMLNLMIRLGKKHPEIENDIDEIFNVMDDPEGSSGVFDKTIKMGSGRDTECGPEVGEEADNMQLSPAVGEVDNDSDKGPVPGKVPTKEPDTGSVTNGETKPGAVPENISIVEPGPKAGKK